jgi:hypothetical protein
VAAAGGLMVCDEATEEVGLFFVAAAAAEAEAGVASSSESSSQPTSSSASAAAPGVSLAWSSRIGTRKGKIEMR